MASLGSWQGYITCLPDCLAPESIPDAASVACAEGPDPGASPKICPLQQKHKKKTTSAMCNPFADSYGELQSAGTSVPEGQRCTPVCGNGSVPLDDKPLLCRNGQLSPLFFNCRAVRCSLPEGLFSDQNNPEVPFDILKGAAVLWNQTFPNGGLDYPAEDICDSASTSAVMGRGCSTCYSPMQTVQVSVPKFDGLSQLLFAFEARQGRRLALVFEEHGD